MASAWARLAAAASDDDTTRILEKEWGGTLPDKVIEAGLRLKARFSNLS